MNLPALSPTRPKTGSPKSSDCRSACSPVTVGLEAAAGFGTWHGQVCRSAACCPVCFQVSAEAEEVEFYENRAPADWLEALAPLGTDADKPFLEIAPWLIVVFAESYGLDDAGERVKNYYVQESVGIATGMLISAAHAAGLATLTHTPSPMRFLGTLLGRPERERAFLILVVGHPAEDAMVPSLVRKPLEAIASFV